MPKPNSPALTVDTLIELIDRPDRPIILIKRKNIPFGWAIPGGFVDIGESLEQAAIREAAEETSLKIKLTYLLNCYSNPNRDPRGHTVSAVYIAQASGEPVAADDADEVGIFTLGNWPAPLAFDHQLILNDYQQFRQHGQRPAVAQSC